MQVWDTRKTSNAVFSTLAHQSTLCVDWNVGTHELATGGNDCKIRVFRPDDSAESVHPTHTINTVAPVGSLSWRKGFREGARRRWLQAADVQSNCGVQCNCVPPLQQTN